MKIYGHLTKIQAFDLQSVLQVINEFFILKILQLRINRVFFLSLSLFLVNIILVYPYIKGFFLEYFFFALFFSFYIVSTFLNPRSAANFFLCLFLTLGFYIKVFSYLYFSSFYFVEPVGNFAGEKEIFSRSIFLITFAIISIMTIQKLFFKYLHKKIVFNSTFSRNISDNKVLFFQSACFLLFATICYLNYQYEIYQKGMVISFFFNIARSTIAWGVLFGFAAAVAVFPVYISDKKLQLISIFLVLATMMISSISALSSTYIILASSVLFGFYYLCRETMTQKYLIAFCLFVGLSFFLSFKIVTELRHKRFTSNSSKVYDITASSPNFVKTLFTLSTARWVGLESVLAGVSYKFERESVFNEINSEKPSSLDRTSLYDIKVAKSVYISNLNNPGVFSMTTPGFIGWISILNNVPLLFISVATAFFVILLSEYLIFYLSKNLLVTSILGQALAYRFVHFGYMPTHTYKMFFGILLSIFLSCLINFLICKTKFFAIKTEVS